MTIDAELVDIITQAIQASYQPERWEPLCDQLVRKYDATNFILLGYDPEEATGSRIYASENFRSVAGELQKDLMSGDAADDNAIYMALLEAQPYQFASEAATLGVGSDAEIPSNSFRDAVLKRTGARARHGGRLNDIGPYLDVLTMHFGHNEALAEPLVRDINALMPILGKALETGRIVERLTNRHAELLSAFDLLDFGAAIAEADGRIVAANRRFEEIERERDALAPGGGVLAGLTADDTKKLRDLAMAATHPGASPASLILSVARRSGQLPLVVKAAPIRSDEIARRSRTLTLLLVIDPEETGRIGAGGLAAFGLLSPEELEVCDMLVRGVEPLEIARDRDVPEAIARAQIDTVAAKLAVNSRLDLVRLAMATHAPMRDGDPQI